MQVTQINFAPTSFSTRSTPNLHIVTTSGSPNSSKDKNKIVVASSCTLLVLFAKSCDKGAPKIQFMFHSGDVSTDFSVQESSTRGRATTSAPCPYRVVYERLLSPSAPPQIFFCEQLPWKLISHSATSQDFRHPVKDPIKDS